MKIVDNSIEICTNHFDAHHRVRDAYSLWLVAYGNLTPQDFLKRLVGLPETGDRARETAKFLIRNPERWK